MLGYQWPAGIAGLVGTSKNLLRARMTALGGARSLAYLHDMSRSLCSARLVLRSLATIFQGALLLLCFGVGASIGDDTPPAPTHASTQVLVFGDSLSAAYKLPAEDGWVALLRERLDAQAPGRFEVTNASASGETTSGGLTRLPEVLETGDYDWVLLELGANDGLRGLPLNVIQANLQTLIDRVEARGAKVVLLGIMLPTNYGPAYADPFAAMYARLAETNDLPGLPFLLEGAASDRELMLEDGLHPNAEGQKQLLENVWSVVEPLWDLNELKPAP
ncbi:arylesterase [Guyparkeria hydrothermalis]|uniref:arylesterase n=1 Tax=Guyparkeria hydrothermalis TaxID=923 RepID=UPI0020214D21|nr:arylesterase [Guyparkeria hydrothermalis]MCL7744844.1 arylesterase [Guyparkeria hydrothermalis]